MKKVIPNEKYTYYTIDFPEYKYSTINVGSIEKYALEVCLKILNDYEQENPTDKNIIFLLENFIIKFYVDFNTVTKLPAQQLFDVYFKDNDELSLSIYYRFSRSTSNNYLLVLEIHNLDNVYSTKSSKRSYKDDPDAYRYNLMYYLSETNYLFNFSFEFGVATTGKFMMIDNEKLHISLLLLVSDTKTYRGLEMIKIYYDKANYVSDYYNFFQIVPLQFEYNYTVDSLLLQNLGLNLCNTLILLPFFVNQFKTLGIYKIYGGDETIYNNPFEIEDTKHDISIAYYPIYPNILIRLQGDEDT